MSKSRKPIVLPAEISAAVLRWHVTSWACDGCGATFPAEWDQVNEPGFSFPSWGVRLHTHVAGGYRHELVVSPLCSRCEEAAEREARDDG